VARLVRDYDLTLDWRGFELHPETPRGGMELARLFPGMDLDAMHDRLASFAAGFGVTDLARHRRLPNTRRALAVAEHARDQGRLDAFRQATMDAHWRDARDIEDLEVLAALAAGAGLDPESARRAADDPTLLARIDATRQESKRLGVPGIPTFVLGALGQGARAVVGCQPYQVLADLADKVGAARRLPVDPQP
jgi:predicted DsbA family dithiol-disulfide isomerase